MNQSIIQIIAYAIIWPIVWGSNEDATRESFF